MVLPATAQTTWTIRTSAADNEWLDVTYGNGLFVAVAQSGIGNRVMTSPDGITWTIRTSAANNNWFGVTYGNGLFVAVAYSGRGNRVMTSGSLIPPHSRPHPQRMGIHRTDGVATGFRRISDETQDTSNLTESVLTQPTAGIQK